MAQKAQVLDLNGKKTKEVELPECFNEDVRSDVIKRAVQVIQSRKRQPYGASTEAGMRHVVTVSKRRRDYRTSYGYGISRTARKVFSRSGRRFYWVGARAPYTVGGRRAHPPKSSKIWALNINDKERKLAIRSAIAASSHLEHVGIRHSFTGNVPLILDKSFEKVKKTSEVRKILENIGLREELQRAGIVKVRAGKGKMRNRKYKRRVGPLVVYDKEEGLQRAARNLSGVEVCNVRHLNAELLAPGTVPGRLVVWTERAINALQKEELYR